MFIPRLAEGAMKLWTHHPSSFRVETLLDPIDPKQGQYWNYQERNFRYREMAPMLWNLLGTDQFLWCCTLRGVFVRPTEDVDLMEWEINAPPCRIIAYISSPIWENLVWSKSDSWDGLVAKNPPRLGHKDIHALVSVPLPAGSVVCHGQLPPQYTHQQMEEAAQLVRNPPPADPAFAWELEL